MIKNPIQEVTNKLQYRAIGIVNGIYKPNNIDQINRGTLTDKEGKILETVIKLSEAMPASLSASSKEVKRSLLIPFPFVKNIFFGTQSWDVTVIHFNSFYLIFDCN